MSLAGVFLWGNGLLYGGAGVAALAAPGALLAGAGVALMPTSGVADIRAVYGGVPLGLALFCCGCAALGVPRPGLWAVAALSAGAFAGRLLGVLLEGATVPMLYIGGFELVWAGLALYLLSTVRDR